MLIILFELQLDPDRIKQHQELNSEQKKCQKDEMYDGDVPKSEHSCLLPFPHRRCLILFNTSYLPLGLRFEVLWVIKGGQIISLVQLFIEECWVGGPLE